jgi:hypothetical protein
MLQKVSSHLNTYFSFNKKLPNSKMIAHSNER